MDYTTRPAVPPHRVPPHRARPHDGPERPQISLRTAFGVLIGLSIGFNFEIIGRITGSELLFLALLPVVVAFGAAPPLSPLIRRLLVLAAVWGCAQLASDVVNDSELGNTVRGGARAVATAGLIFGYFCLGLDDRRRFALMFVAIAVGLFLGYLFLPGEFALADPWKFGYGRTATMLAVAAAGVLWSLKLTPAAFALCLVISAVNVALGFRSMAGIVFLTGAATVAVPLLGGWFGRASKFKAFAVGAALVVAATGLVQSYEIAASQGLLGEDEKIKYEYQSTDNNLLLSGRVEFLVSSQAIADSPIWGHGSWASSDYYYDLFMNVQGNYSYVLPDEMRSIPTHSYIFGAWVEGGVFAALFWIYVVFLISKISIVFLNKPELASPIYLFCLFELTWNIFFSPYGLDGRVVTCFEIVGLVVLLSSQKSVAAVRR